MAQVNYIRKMFFEKGMNYAALCQYLAGIFPRSRQINLKPPLTIAWDQPGTT